MKVKAVRKKPNLFIFILMPFDNPLTIIYKNYIQKPLEAKGFTVKRADDIYKSNPILKDILDKISMADLIIAELTGRNPNVFYELGRAHEQEKYVIQICQNTEDIPFDLRHIRTIIYENSPEGCEKLEKTIFKFIKDYIDDREEKPTIRETKQRKKVNAEEASNLRLSIEKIKTSEKTLLSDLIIISEFKDLITITKMIYAELSFIKYLSEYQKLASIYDFIHFSIMLRDDPVEKISLFKELLKQLKKRKKIFKISNLHAKFHEYVVVPEIQRFLLDNNIIDDIISLYGRSQSYNEAGYWAKTLFNLKDILDSNQVIQIARNSINNAQIYQSHKGNSFTFRLLLHKSTINIPKTLMKELVKKEIWPEEF